MIEELQYVSIVIERVAKQDDSEMSSLSLD